MKLVVPRKMANYIVVEIQHVITILLIDKVDFPCSESLLKQGGHYVQKHYLH